MRPYYIHVYRREADGSLTFVPEDTLDVDAPTSQQALDLAEQMAGNTTRYPSARIVVSNDRGRTLAAYENGEFEYLGL